MTHLQPSAPAPRSYRLVPNLPEPAMVRSPAVAARERALRGLDWLDLALHPHALPPAGTEVLLRRAPPNEGTVLATLHASPAMLAGGVTSEVLSWVIADGFSLLCAEVSHWRAAPPEPFCRCCGEMNDIARLQHSASGGVYRCNACRHEFSRSVSIVTRRVR